MSESRNAAPAAIFHSFEGCIADESAFSGCEGAVAQLLLQHQIPFRYVPGDRLELLSEIRLLIMPRVLALSDDAAAEILKWVKKGGRILATGRTSLYDEWMRQRKDYALGPAFGFKYSPGFEDAHQHALLYNPETGCWLAPGDWGLTLADGRPACRVGDEAMLRAIRSAIAGYGLPDVLCPVAHVAAAVRKDARGGILLGLVNYSDEAVRGIQVVFPQSAQKQRIMVWTAVESWKRVPCLTGRDGRKVALAPELEVEMLMRIAGVPG